jgi:hypothetical protein
VPAAKEGDDVAVDVSVKEAFDLSKPNAGGGTGTGFRWGPGVQRGLTVFTPFVAPSLSTLSGRGAATCPPPSSPEASSSHRR